MMLGLFMGHVEDKFVISLSFGYIIRTFLLMKTDYLLGILILLGMRTIDISLEVMSTIYLFLMK